MAKDPREQMQQAMLARQSGDIDKVQSICKEIVAAHPKFLPAKLMLAMSQTAKGQVEEAVKGFREIIRVDPNCQPAYNWLAAVTRTEGRPEEALPIAEQAVRLAPQNADALTTLGMCLCDLERYAEAAELFRRALVSSPRNAPGLVSLATAYTALGRLTDAVVAARKAVAIAPDIDSLRMLSRLESELGNAFEAAEAMQRVVDAEPNVAADRLLLAQALRESGRQEEADLHLAEAERLDPSLDMIYSERAICYQSLGRFEEAKRTFEAVIQKNPSLGSAYYGIVSAQRLTEEDEPLVVRMEELSLKDDLPPNDLIHIHYALGKSHADLGRYELAMHWYDSANELAKHHWLKHSFDRDQFEKQVDQRIKLFTPELFDRVRSQGNESQRPLFVVGMMRSGTTLTEQMLTRHSNIGGVGEQGLWSQSELDVVDFAAGSLKLGKIKRLALEFLQILERHSGKRLVIDKNPANVMAVGLLHAAFPNAKIIHIKRHPVDTALSIYMTPVKRPPPFTCDRSNIVFAYRQYQRIAEHWRTVIPAGSYLEVEYETIVGDGRAAVGSMLDFLGEEWEEACLHPEGNSNVVLTPSFWQVRQPLYTSSVARWKQYERYLGEFADLL